MTQLSCTFAFKVNGVYRAHQNFLGSATASPLEFFNLYGMAPPKKRSKSALQARPPTMTRTTVTTTRKVQHQPTRKQLNSKTIQDIGTLMSDLTTAIAHLSFKKKKQPLHLFQLPQEIQDMTFDFAYPAVPGLRAITKKQWDRAQWKLRRDQGPGYICKPFPEAKVSEFLVSKRFFVSAARSFISHQTFDRIFMRELILHYDDSAILQYVAKAELCLISISMLRHAGVILPNLRSLNLEISEFAFEETLPSKFPWEEELTILDLRPILEKYDIDRITGVEEFNADILRSRSAKSPEEQAMWRKNAGKLEDLVRAQVTRERTRRNNIKSGSAIALYPGPSVCSGGSIIMRDHSAPAKSKLPQKSRKLGLHDLPDDAEDLIALIEANSGGVMSLIKELKQKARKEEL